MTRVRSETGRKIGSLGRVAAGVAIGWLVTAALFLVAGAAPISVLIGAVALLGLALTISRWRLIGLGIVGSSILAGTGLAVLFALVGDGLHLIS